MATFIAGVPQVASFPRNQPLPANPYDQHNDAPLFDAYNECLLNEAEANQKNDEKRRIQARCLGYLITEAPDSDARNVIAHEILECKANTAKMSLLADLYINHLLRLFRQQKGYTPFPSDHPSPPSFEEDREFFSAAVEPAPKDRKTAKESALRRDSYRCMVTGYADFASFKRMTLAEQHMFGVIGRAVRVTNYSHIFPPSTNWDLKPGEHHHPKTTTSRDVRSIVHAFGRINVLAELDGDNAHRLSNGLTLGTDAHSLFAALDLWFEKVPGQDNTYVVRTLFRDSILNPVVTFATTTDLELPNPKYLRLHAAVCRVAHMSGAAGYLDFLDRENEKTKVLARDGELLNARLCHVLLTA